MVPAMDRSSAKAARLIWLGAALLMAVLESGCAELKAQILGNNTPPAEIGQPGDGDSVYPQAHRTTTPSPTSSQPGPWLAGGFEPDGAQRVQVQEVGAAMLPAEVARKPSNRGVDLQPPLPIDAKPDSRLNSASVGVPNASRILASLEPRSQTKPTTDNSAQLVAEARTALNALSTYQVALHRQERVNDSLLPEEDVVLAVRREPRAVRLSWPSGDNQGREVLYRADEPGGQMHIKMANAALPRLTMSPQSPMVMRNSRHPITEAGFDSILESLETALKAPEASGLKSTGLETPDGFDHAVQGLVRTTPSGETWRVYLDPQTHLPALVNGVDARGNLLERYVFRDVRANLSELASADAFDANARWGPARGLFGRLVRGDQPTAETPPR
jgi:Protein of unknown function (DUF1571)